jgi:hypothetical protein
LLAKLRSYRGVLCVGNFSVGTETAYFDIDRLGVDDALGATLVAQVLLMSVFGVGTGLTRSVMVRRLEHEVV